MIESFFVSIFCLMASFFILGMTILAWKKIRPYYKNQVIPNVIFFFVAYKIIVYFFLPAVIRVFSSYQYVIEDNVPLIQLAEVYGIEVVSYLCWFCAFYFIIKLFRVPSKSIQGELLFIDSKALGWNESLLIFSICIGFILSCLGTIYKFDFILTQLFGSLFVYGGMVFGIYLFTIGLRFRLRSHFFIGLLTSLFSLSYLQTRGALIYGIVWLSFLLIMYRMKRVLIILFGMCLILLFSGLILGGLPKLRFIDPETGKVSMAVNVDDKKSEGRSLINDIEWRFGANTRMSTSFIKMYDRGDSAGINPIKHSFLGFLPRSVNPDKPHPSTLEPNNIYSQGMYLISREIHGYNTYSMVEFSTGAHFYWEFGFLGVILLSAISAWYICFSTLFFEKFGVVGAPLVVVIFKPWGYVDPKIWVSDAVMQMYQIIFPLLFIYGVFWILPKIFTIKKYRFIKRVRLNYENI